MHDQLHHLAGAYAIDAVDHDERIDFDAHAASCGICSDDIRNGREVAAELAHAVAIAPPAHLRSLVMHDIVRTRQLPPIVSHRAADTRRSRIGRHRTLGVLATAAACVATVISLVAIGRGGVDVGVSEVAAAPDSVVVALDGDDGSIRVVWSRDRGQVAVFGNELRDPGPDRTYALWALDADGRAVPAGLFAPDDSGRVRAVVDLSVDGSVGWGVTIEPAGGSFAPSSPVIFEGSI